MLVIVAGLVGACRPVDPAQEPAPSDTRAAAGVPVGLVATAPVPRLDPRWLVPGTDTMIMSRAADVQPVAAGRMPGRVVVGMTIERVQRRPGDRGRKVLDVSFEQRDTIGVVARTVTRVDAVSLLPLGQRADLGDGHVVTLVYLGNRLVGVDSAPGRAPRYFSAPVSDTAYASGSIDLLLRALPLADGFHTSLPLYFPSDGEEEQLPVRVAGHEHIITRAGHDADCWLVDADFPGGITEHFWIDERSHAILRILAHDDEATLVRYDR